MSTESSSAASERRWLIGISISIFFGLFGAVMAVLAYRDRGPRETYPTDAELTVVEHTVAAATAVPSTPVVSTSALPAPTASGGKASKHPRK